ncbi:MAG TPA: PBP1A family penicillin-binding protein [Chloroflexota bacterium]|nr:PBP1A family penicillin-binding protein [Chloroflexota bacterium]
MAPSVKRAIVERRQRERAARPGIAKPVLFALSAGMFAIMLALAAFMVPFVGGIMAAARASDALGSIQVQPHGATFQTSRIFDRNGTLLYEFVDPKAGRRTAINLADVPESVIDATIAVEDKNFYTNPGFDVQGLVRAAYDDVVNHKIVEGGSSITQQLVKQVYLTPEVSFDRKIREIIIAFTLTRSMTKDQILQTYLNQIYYGNQAYGVEAAAEAYFGKNVRNLDLAESAMLAGLPQSPSQYDPINNLQAAKQRQLDVLNLMVDQGYISSNQAAGARDEPLKFAAQGIDLKAPHWVFYVRNYLEQKYGPNFIYGTGLNIKTTLDLGLNNKAQQIVQQDLANIPPSKNVNDAALVAVDPNTGQILAMIGSRDYNQVLPNGTMDGRFNAATAPLQPGSSFKPFAYVTDFEKGRSPATMVLDAGLGHTFPDGPGVWFEPKNYDLKYHGWLPLRYTLANSLNIPAVKVLADAGVDPTLATAHAMGITTLTDRARLGLGLSLVLGAGEVLPLDMASAYGVFATGGQRYPLNPILSITDSSGKVIEQYQKPQPQQVLKPEYAYLISSVLSDDHARQMEFGAHSALWLPDRPVAVKTGTTDQFRANWTIGYTPSLSVAVWAGNSNHTPMNNVIGIDGAGPIWHDFMEYALRNTPPQPFPVPPNIVDACVPANVGMPPSGAQKCWNEVFVKGTEKTAVGQSISIGGTYHRSTGSPAPSASPVASASPSAPGSPSPISAASPPSPSAPAPPSPNPVPPVAPAAPVAVAPAPAAPAALAPSPPPDHSKDKPKKN